MADNIPLPNSTENIGADDIAGAKYQRIKVILGSDGINAGDVSSTNPMPVTGAVTVSNQLGLTDTQIRATPIPVTISNPLATNTDNTLKKIPVLVMVSSVNAVTPGSTFSGWVSGSIASLAASASVDTIFDLGPSWAQYVNIAIGIKSSGPSIALGSISVYGSDTTTISPHRRLNATPDDVSIPPASSYVYTAIGGNMLKLRPFGRYVIVSVTNVDSTNAQGALSGIDLAAYPN